MTNISKKTLSISTFWLTESSKTQIWGPWGTLKPPSDPEQEGRNHQEIEAEGCRIIRILRRWEARATLRLVHVGGALPRSPGRKALPWKRHPCERSGMARWTFLRSEKEKEKVASMVSGNWHCVEQVDAQKSWGKVREARWNIHVRFVEDAACLRAEGGQSWSTGAGRVWRPWGCFGLERCPCLSLASIVWSDAEMWEN